MRLPSFSQRRLVWPILMALLLITALAYWPGTHGGYVLDDFPNIVDNPALQTPPLTAQAMLRAAVSAETGTFGRPIAMMSFALNAHFTGQNAQAMKLTNLAIHLLNGLLVFVLLRLILREYGRLRKEGFLSPSPQPSPVKGEGEEEVNSPIKGEGEEPEALDDESPLPSRESGRACPGLDPGVRGETDWLALTVTAAWLLAPINLTAVLYTVQRMTALAATFTLAALILFVLARRWLFTRRHRAGAIALLLVAALVLVPLSVLTKESGVLTLAYALAIEWVLFRFRNGGTSVLASSSPRRTPVSWITVAFFSAFLLVPLVLGLLWLFPGVVSPGAWANRDFTVGERLLTEGRVLWHYIYWTLVPNIQAMTLFHDAFPVARGLFSPWWNLPAWLGIGALLATGLACVRRRPLIALGLLWFLVGQTLTAGFISLELVFEHREYLPSLGLLLALFALLLPSRSQAKLGRLRIATVCALLLLYGGGLALRAQSWSNPLLQSALAAQEHPQSPRATYAWGRALAAWSKFDPALVPKAEAALEAANRVPGQGILPTSNLILLAHQTGSAMPIAWFRAMATKLRSRPPNPGDVSALNSLVQCAIREKNPCQLPAGGMTVVFAAALDHAPSSPAVMAIYGNYLLNARAQPQAAARIFRLLATRHPQDSGYHFSLGVCLAASGDGEGARRELVILRRLNRFGIHDAKLQQLTQLIHRLYPSKPQP